MSLSMIAAVARNGCIGKGGKLPWDLPEDMRRFRELTIGKVVVMGRKTWESLPDRFRPLPNRTNVVISRQAGYTVLEGVRVFPGLREALQAFEGSPIMVIGGGQIYAEAMPLADELLITHVDMDVDGDAYFPSIDPAVWIEKERLPHAGYAFSRYAHR